MTIFEWLNKHQIEKATFARTLGVAESTLYKYINLERIPRLDIAVKLHFLTGGDVDYLMMLQRDIQIEVVEFMKQFSKEPEPEELEGL